jgi:hypothetical protein
VQQGVGVRQDRKDSAAGHGRGVRIGPRERSIFARRSATTRRGLRRARARV